MPAISVKAGTQPHFGGNKPQFGITVSAAPPTKLYQRPINGRHLKFVVAANSIE